MPSLPQRKLLAGQTAAYLTEEMRRGKWRDWLPSERGLAEELQVSRNTLRAALTQLRREGLVASVHGAGNRILAPRDSAAESPARSHDVAFVTPEPLERLRPTLTLWIDELRGLLGDHECRVRLFHGPQYFRANPGAALRKLVEQNPHGCWVLVLSNQATQRWFAKSGLPCVVAGTCYPGIDLPNVDLDHRAMCRHAAGVLLGLGHRRIAFLNRRLYRAGDMESTEGFLEGVRASPHADAEAFVVNHEASVEDLNRHLRRLMLQKNRPTALLVANPYFYLTVTSSLAQLGWKIPSQISVLSRDEDPFLSFLVPTPARYAISAHVFAKNMLRSVLGLLKVGEPVRTVVRIMPDFIRGESMAPPPSEQS